jgi:hypothetical protein
MPARHSLARRSTAVLVTLLITLTALPAMASARPFYDGPGYQLAAPAESSTPAPTVVRTIVREESIRALPIALAGAALIIAIAGTCYVLISVAPLRQQLRGQH